MELTPTLILNLVLLIVPPAVLVLVFRQWLVRHIRWTVALTALCDVLLDRKSTRLNSSHIEESRMPSSA